MNLSKDFVSFANGVKLSDSQITGMLNELLNKWRSGIAHGSISTGDTKVSFHVWLTSTEFVVATSAGYSRVTYYVDEYPLLREREFDYRR